jgi:hypothetical protein
MHVCSVMQLIASLFFCIDEAIAVPKNHPSHPAFHDLSLGVAPRGTEGNHITAGFELHNERRNRRCVIRSFY